MLIHNMPIMHSATQIKTETLSTPQGQQLHPTVPQPASQKQEDDKRSYATIPHAISGHTLCLDFCA